jgi:hypothetical protein
MRTNKKIMAKKKILDNQIAFYETPDGSVNIEVLYAEENIWLPQKRMAELFDTTVPNVNMHLKNIFKKKELEENSVIKDFLTTASDGKLHSARRAVFLHRQYDFGNDQIEIKRLQNKFEIEKALKN